MTSPTVSLEWAKSLCAWNYPQQESYFVWVQTVGAEWMLLPYSSAHEDLYQDNFVVRAAPAAEEILRRLPATIKDDEGMTYAVQVGRRDDGGWDVYYWWDEDTRQLSSVKGPHTREDTLANAAAALWCLLREHDLLNLSDGN